MSTLQHYGILGMRWGVRRSRDELDRLAGRKTTNQERKAKRDQLAAKTRELKESGRRFTKMDKWERRHLRQLYRSTPHKVAEAVAIPVLKHVLHAAFAPGFDPRSYKNLANLNPAARAKLVQKILLEAGLEYKTNEAVRKTIAKRYDEDFNEIEGTKRYRVGAVGIALGSELLRVAAPLMGQIAQASLKDLAESYQVDREFVQEVFADVFGKELPGIFGGSK